MGFRKAFAEACEGPPSVERIKRLKKTVAFANKRAETLPDNHIDKPYFMGAVWDINGVIEDMERKMK